MPHSWSSQFARIMEPVKEEVPIATKKSLVNPAVDANKIYQLYFEGSNNTAKVYVNDNEVGDHIDDYIGFTFDITKFIKSGNNEVLFRVDNSYNFGQDDIRQL